MESWSILAELTSEDIFRLHPKIRWTAFTSDSGEVVFSNMRPGVKSYTSDEVDRTFMEFGPLIMSGVSERLTPAGSAGRVRNIIVNLEKDSVLLAKLKSGYLAISVDRADAITALQDIAESIETFTV